MQTANTADLPRLLPSGFTARRRICFGPSGRWLIPVSRAKINVLQPLAVEIPADAWAGKVNAAPPALHRMLAPAPGGFGKFRHGKQATAERTGSAGSGELGHRTSALTLSGAAANQSLCLLCGQSGSLQGSCICGVDIDAGSAICGDIAFP